MLVLRDRHLEVPVVATGLDELAVLALPFVYVAQGALPLIRPLAAAGVELLGVLEPEGEPGQIGAQSPVDVDDHQPVGGIERSGDRLEALVAELEVGNVLAVLVDDAAQRDRPLGRLAQTEGLGRPDPVAPFLPDVEAQGTRRQRRLARRVGHDDGEQRRDRDDGHRGSTGERGVTRGSAAHNVEQVICPEPLRGVTSAGNPNPSRSTMLRRAAAIIALLAWSAGATAQESGPAESCELGLVLSGGGARGAAHVGVLEVLEANGIRPDCITGASMGAIVGSLYAAGFRLEEIQTLIGGLTWRNIYAEPMNRGSVPIAHRLEQQRTALRLGFGADGIKFPRGILHDGRLNNALIEFLAPAGFVAERQFDRLPIPFRTVGTDLRTGNRIVLSEGDLARAVRASMSVPLAYPAVEWGDAVLVDGGLVDNLPVDLARRMGAEYVIAVDVRTPLDPDVDPDIVGVTQRIVDLLYDTKNRQNAADPDLFITPQLDDHSFSDYSTLDLVMERGREAAEAALAAIPDRFKQERRNRAPTLGRAAFGDRRIGHIEVVGNEYLSDRFLIRESDLEVDRRFAFDDVLHALDHLYSTSLVQGAWIDLRKHEDNSMAVELRVVEQYRHTADVGLAYQSDDQAQGFLRLETRDVLGGGERLQLNGYASARDLQVGVTLRGEQLFGAHFGYQVDIEYHEERPKFYLDNEFINRADFDRRHVRFGVDWQLGGNHLGQAGFLVGRASMAERLGVPYEATVEQKRLLFARYVWDTLESLTLPRRGISLEAVGERNEASLGATTSYWRVDARLRLARSIGAIVLEGRARYGFSSGEPPVSEWFTIGGPDYVPGAAREEFWGRQAVGASISAGFDPFSIARVYGRIGIAGTWDKVEEIGWNSMVGGIGFGATVATPVGPLQLDYGWAEDGRNRFAIALGWQ